MSACPASAIDYWLETSLGTIAEINPGRTKPDTEDATVSFLAMSDVSEGGRILRSQERSYADVCQGFTSFTDDDVLVAKITPCFENGKGALVTDLIGGIGFGSTEFHVLRAKREVVTPSFVYWLTRSEVFRLVGERNMLGSAGQKRVPTEFLRSYKVQLPPILEQQKIADILTAVDDKLDLIARQITATQALKQGLMQTLFTKGVGTQDADGHWLQHTDFRPLDNRLRPSTWQLVQFGSVAPIIRREVDVQPEGYYPELGLRSFGKGTFHKPTLTGAQIGGKRLFVIKAGDLLLSNVFAWEGSVAVARPEDDGRFGSHRYITCAVNAEEANAHFIARYLLLIRKANV